MSRLLVTGGAGYVGSHAALAIAEAGHEIAIIDNLSTGHEWAALGHKLIVADLMDQEALDGLFSSNPFDAVIHFAASIAVPESMENPAKYYQNNTCATLSLLAAMERHGISKLVYSSTAAVYGEPDVSQVDEEAPLTPVNPYGASKMFGERMIADMAASSGMSYVILRYFNVAGADPGLRVGQVSEHATHLVKVACMAAMGLLPEVVVFGDDYSTPDGTGVRDYIHVSDLAQAHLAALTYLDNGGPPSIYNCGYGQGYSVMEVLKAAQKISGADFRVSIGPRRPGDPAALVASAGRIHNELGWTPLHNDLEFIIRTSLVWEKKAIEMGYAK